MSHSPGHREHPEHQVRERRLEQPVEAQADGNVLAQSLDVLRVDEDGQPPRYYFPRQDVHQAALQPSQTRTHCPFKGDASYFDLALGDHVLKDAVWAYEEPYDEHEALKGRLAFDSVRYPEIRVHAEGGAAVGSP